MNKWLKHFIGFFPIQLLVLQFKRNYLSLVFWAVLFAIIFKKFFLNFGVPYLFLSPEYLGDVSFWSCAILGFSIGGFIMAFNTYSYVMLSRSFPFLATLKRPFLKFSINNAIIPFLFSLSLLIQLIVFSVSEELNTIWQALLHGLGFVVGLTLFLVLSAYYFFKTNKNLDLVKNRKSRSLITSWIPTFRRSKIQKYYPETYLSGPFEIGACRDVSHYSQKVLNKVYSQNHINAVFFEVLVICSFILFGFLQDFSFFLIPAGASIVLLFTIAQMIVSAFYNWFKDWAIFVILLIVIISNGLSAKFETLQFKSQAIGLEYDGEKASFDELNVQMNDLTVQARDIHHQIQLLNRWKKQTGKSKPKLIILNSSGGGIRSAYWNFLVLDKLENETNGTFGNELQMITGASGGMIGSSYFRNVNYLHQDTADWAICHKNISDDLLNQVSFSLVTNDLFLKFKTDGYSNRSYIKDRGFSFEENLINNLGAEYNQPLSYFDSLENQAKIPQMIFAPTIIDDGRRMLISTQPLGFLSKSNRLGISQNVEYSKLLNDKDAMNTRLASVLRMNATFPYIMPMVTLPTEPEVTIMDAGLRDNYGGKLSMEYIFELRNWISENTSGVVIVQIRDVKKQKGNYSNQDNSILKRFMKPVGNISQNLFKTQDYDQELMFNLANKSVDFPIDFVSFNLLDEEKDMSLSWHLTEVEKKRVQDAWKKFANQSELRKLVHLIQ